MGAPSSYSKNLGLELMATGAKAGTWGVINNKNLEMLDDAVNGMVEIPLGGSSHTLATTDGAISPGHSKVLRFIGALSTDCLVTISPANREHLYFVVNDTLGGFKLQFTQGTGGNFILDNGYAAVIHCEGLGAGSKVWGTLANLQVNALRVLTTLSLAPGASAIFNTVTVSGVATFTSPAIFEQGITVNNLVASLNGGLAVAGAMSFSGPMTQTGTGLARFTKMRVDVGGDVSGDMYYRGVGPDFGLARIPPGAIGSVLTYTASGPAWSPGGGLTKNMPATGFADRQLLGVQANQLVGTPFWWSTVWGGVSRQATFAPLFAFHVWAPGGDKVMIDGDGTPGTGLRWGTNTALRWELALTDLESGGDAGGNLTLFSGTDAGGVKAVPMRIMRSTGNALFGNANPTLSNGVVNINSPDDRTPLVLRVGPTALPGIACLLIQRADGTTAFIVNNNGDVGVKSLTYLP